MNRKTKSQLIKVIAVALYLICVICSELSYRETLFEKSLIIEENIQKKLSASGKGFFEFITNFGEVKVTLPLLAIVFVFFPLNKAFAFVSAYLYASYFTNLMQMIYHSPRPFWNNTNIKPSCNTAFGNPSGHSFTTFSIYFILFHYTTDFEYFKAKTKGKVLKGLILLLYLLLMFCIITSRLVVGAHGINQVLYGSLMGIGLYFIIHHVMEYHSMTNEEFYNHLLSRNALIIYPLIYTVLTLITVFIYLFDQIDQLAISELENKLLKLCTNKNRNHILYNDNFFQTLSLCGLIGSHCGLWLLYSLCVKKYTKERGIIINEWNKKSSIPCFAIRLPILLISSTFILLNFLESKILWIRFVFKAAASMALSLFGFFGIGLYLCLILGKCNQDIYSIHYVNEVLNQKEQFLLDKL